MTDGERDAFLAEQRTCRVGSVNPDGSPHVTPLWFVWDGSVIWLYSIMRSRRWSNLVRDPRVSVVVDTGDGYFELRGVEFTGVVEPVAEQPRTGEPNPELDEPERLFAARYAPGAPAMGYDGRHAWLRLVPEKAVSWDFRKLGGGETALTQKT